MQLHPLLQQVGWRFTHVTIVAMGPPNTWKQLAAMTEHVTRAGQEAGVVLEMLLLDSVASFLPFLDGVR